MWRRSKKRPRRRRGWWRQFSIEVYLRSGWLFAWRTGWTGLPEGSVMVPSEGLFGPPLLTLVERLATEMLAKKARRTTVDGDAAQMVDEEFQKHYPTLFDYLTQSRWPDGTPRLTSSLLIFTDNGQVKAMLRDKEAGECLWVACPSLWMIFDVFEAKLCDEEADWRVDRQQEGQTAARRKKGVDGGRG